LPQMLIYIFDRFPVGFVSSLERDLYKLKMDFPKEIIFFKTVPERRKVAILLRRDRQDVVKLVERIIESVSGRFSVRVQNKICRKAKRKGVDMKILAWITILSALLSIFFCTPESSKKDSKLLIDQINVSLKQNTCISELKSYIDRLGLSRNELMVALALYMLRSRSDIESVIELCNWALNMDYKDVLRSMKSLESRGLIRIGLSENRATPSIPLIIGLRKVVFLLIKTLKNLQGSVKKADLSRLLSKIGNEEVYMIDGASARKIHLHEVVRNILLELRPNSEYADRSDLLLLLYLLSGRRKIISKRLLKNIILNLTKFAKQ